MPTQVECNVCLKMLSQNSLGNHMKHYDLKEIFSNFFQLKPFKEEDLVRLSKKVGLRDRNPY